MKWYEPEGIAGEIYMKLAVPMKIDELERVLPNRGKREIKNALEELSLSGMIMKNKKNRYAHSEHYSCVSGTFYAAYSDCGFVVPGSDGEDISIAFEDRGGAWHGDRVLVHVSQKLTTRGKRCGEIIKILARSEKEITGVIQQDGTRFLLKTLRPVFPEIEINWRDTGDAKDGDLVMVSMLSYGDSTTLPQAKVNARLGRSGTLEAAIARVLRVNHVSEGFPAEVTKEAESVPQEVGDIYGRFDLRDKLIFTVDGDDAKDFDDAVSIERLENGHWLLGVHIADVSEYVKPGSALDNEAYMRGASVYYPGHVIPMLPFELSNGVCSLNPDVDRFTFSALMEIDKDGRRHKSEFKKAVIRSRARMTYKNVNLIISGDPEACEKYAFLTETVKTMNALAHVLHKRRVERGALQLEIPETEIELDDNGHPTGLNRRERGESERLIEEFMLQANEAVAEYMCRRGDPTIYRIHETPDPDKLSSFARIARPFGYRIDPGRVDDTFQLQAVIDGAKNDPRQRALPSLLLRSLARARYEAECIGHYGLKSKFYLHFTSPIRRYPDLVAHRMLIKAVSGEGFTGTEHEFCIQAAKQSTEREMGADTCERNINDLYIAAYMQQFVGEEFDAEISGISPSGIFVALPNGCEGRIAMRLLEGDFYDYDDIHMVLQGRNTGKRFTLGMPLRVQLIAASEFTGQIEFAIAGTEITQLPTGQYVAASREPKLRLKERKVKKSQGFHYRHKHRRHRR